MSGFLSKAELEALVTGSVQTADLANGAVTNVKLGTGTIKATVIAGGAAGDHTVTGISVGDHLVAVLQIDATDASETYADLTSEFTISAANTINNTGGTVTTGSGLVVIYEDRTA